MKLIFVILLTIFSVNVAANTAEKTILSFCYETWRPNAYKSEDGEHKGKNIELIRKAFASSKVQLQFWALPHLRCLKNVHLGQIDFAMYADINNDLALIDHPIASWDLVLAFKRTTESTTATERHYKRVIISKDYLYSASLLNKLNSMFDTIIKESYYVGKDYDLQRQFKLVDNGFVDAILIDKNRAINQLSKSKSKFDIVISDKPFHSQPQFIGYKLDNQAKANIVYQALTALKQQSVQEPLNQK